MNSFYFTVWSRNSGAVLRRSTNAPANVTQPLRPGRDTGVYLRTRGTVREAFHYTELGDCILAGRTIVTELAASSRFAGWLIAGGCAVLLLGLGGVWLLAGRALKPVEVISGAATRIAAGNLAERINVSETDDELGQLANTLNTTFARLETAFAQQKQFTADASHELRTPLAVMISEAQTTLARERTAADYRETVQACLDTAQQMRKLTESLLQLARFDAGQEKIRRDPLDLARVARDCVAQLHPLADARGVRINCELSPAETRGDADLLARVLTNLITNAIQHSRANGEIHLATRAHAGEASLTVADNGSGIAPEDLPHLFERFYRADKARARANGNSGLGLAICKAIVDAHGGSITAASRAGGGAEFAVRLSVQNIL
ncbi:MAG: HAMP domain-containing protein [Verrucomicrobia bacterium]|nr:MAG: HAMP domain-containing protein [Verrucomicrobiota bacterium]